MSSSPKRVDALEAVRRNPTWYFPSGEFEPRQFVALLTAEIWTSASVANVVTRRVDDWWLVGADNDWLRGENEAFFKLVPLAAGGANASRVEVLLLAFCPVVLTAANGDLLRVRSPEDEVPPDDLLTEVGAGAFARVILFKAPPSHHRSSSAQSTEPSDRSTRIATQLHLLDLHIEEFMNG